MKFFHAVCADYVLLQCIAYPNEAQCASPFHLKKSRVSNVYGLPSVSGASANSVLPLGW